jgi:DNA polymerase-3 subunit alpha
MIEDLSGSIEVTAWSNVYQTTKELWEEGNILIIEGRVRTRNDRVQLNCQAVREYNPQDGADQIEEGDKSKARRLIIRLSESDDEEADIERLQDILRILKQHTGQDEVRLIMEGKQVKFPNMTVGYSDELWNNLLALVGDGGVEVIEI